MFEVPPDLGVLTDQATVVECGPCRGDHGLQQAAAVAVGPDVHGALARELNQVVRHGVKAESGLEESGEVGGDVRRAGCLRGERQVRAWWVPSLVRASSNNAAPGLPVTWGVRVVVVRTAATSAPLPGAGPRAVGRKRSRLVATQVTPRWAR